MSPALSFGIPGARTTVQAFTYALDATQTAALHDQIS
jgi:hypothetical protein